MISTTRHSLMMRSLVFSVVVGALAAENALYHYMPVEFDYGADSRVTANITFGSAPSAEPVKVVVDSGSANFWLWAPGAVVHWGSPYLGVTGPCNETVPTFYDPALSATSTLTNHSSSYAYAGNAKIVAGTQYANDVLAAVGGNGAISSTFALETTGLFRIADNGSCSSVPSYDKAILGLSPYTNTTVGPSFRQNLFETGQVGARTIFMWFEKHIGGLGDLLGGVLFGAVDTSKYTGSLVEVENVVTGSEVGIYVHKPNITVNGVTVTPDDDVTCLIDSGAHADYLPFAYDGDVEGQFYAASNGLLIDHAGVVAFNGTCEDIPQSLNLTYTFAGAHAGESVEIGVPLRNYARGLVDLYSTVPSCLLNLEVGGCMFGAPFLTAATLLADDEGDRVALAQGGVAAEGSGVEESSLVVLGKGKNWDSI